MNKAALYIINAFLSSLIGGVIEIVYTVLQHKNSIDLWELFGSMGKGVIIGTVALYIFLFFLVRFRKKPFIGFFSSFLTVAGLMGLLFLYDVIMIPDIINYFRWTIALITAEILGFILTAGWYRWVRLYNGKLEKKKAAIVD